MKAAAFSVFEKSVWWFAAVKKRGLEGKIADNVAAFAFKLDTLAFKLSALPGVLS